MALLEELVNAVAETRKRRRRLVRNIAGRKVGLDAFAQTWLEGQTNLRPSTRALYRIQLNTHILPKLGHLYLSDICEDDLLALINEMRDGWHYRNNEAGQLVRVQRDRRYSAYTIKAVLVPLGRILNTAVRRGHIASNPLSRLQRDERPSPERRETRVLSHREIAALLRNTRRSHKPLVATALFTGLRLGELLGLTWADVDIAEGVVRVRLQLDRSGHRVPLKTPRASRDVEMMPALVRLLEQHRTQALQAGRIDPTGFVFCSHTGSPLHHRNIARRMLDPAMEQAELSQGGRPRFRFHDLRHTFASVLIAQGHDIVFVGRQLGHSSTQVTLDVYGHLFDKARHAQRMRDELEAAFGELVEPFSPGRGPTSGGRT